MITRRNFLKLFGMAALSGAAFAGYTFGIEPMRLRVKGYQITPPRWPVDHRLRIVALSDVHACNPWMSAERIAGICKRANALNPDIIVLLGDYVAGHRWVTKWVHADDWSTAFSYLEAPLGVHAVLGNHDWWEDRTAQQNGHGPVFGRRALERVGIAVYENDVAKIRHGAHSFWLAGLADQLALIASKKWGRCNLKGVDDLPGTLAKVDDEAPVILLAHEPDIFPEVPDRVSLTLSGHTHGGQVRLFGRSPVVPSRYGNRYAYGHVSEPSLNGEGSNRNLIVSGGLGCSIAPVRLGMPPEINVIDLGA